MARLTFSRTDRSITFGTRTERGDLRTGIFENPTHTANTNCAFCYTTVERSHHNSPFLHRASSNPACSLADCDTATRTHTARGLSYLDNR